MQLTDLKIEYPELPVVEHREEFFDLLEKNQVIIVKADTGSGKSTQLPKFLLEWFCLRHPGAEGERDPVKFKIGVTEPRRLAAISIADRLREELKDEELVSTKIRFWEQGTNEAPIKVMTDGILLQEFRKDRLFRQYNAIMIDEAHERSLNIDILLGIFKTVLSRRPDFKLIVASATLDAKLFEEFYDNSCVMEAEGRTYPVDVEYYFSDYGSASALRDISGKGDSGLIEEARDAILDLETRHRDHLLCFLPTERDIQDLAGELAHELDAATFDVLPLYGRMSPDEQRRIFKHTGKTRVVLATNIAETSLTIPGIAYVVDTGMARISRYNAQARIQGLPVEEISKASARQRTGRAGRVKPGVCIRLYSPENFEKRDEFTEPEIRRSNLANVVLQLRSLGLELENFPFLQSPPHSAFRGAYKTLFELGALTADNSSGHVTKLGRDMTRLPMDVSLSAVLLRARDLGVLQPALIVCSALSIQDPRVVPNDEPERTRIRQLHRKFCGHKSDFLVYVSMWNAFCTDWDGKSWNKLRKFCDKNSMHFLRLREWVDLYEQFSRILEVKFENKVCPFDSFHRDNLHIALLSGFLGGIAHRDIENGCYRLVSGRETHVFPGSDLYAKSVEWLFSAEVRETSRTFLTKAAEIKPEWILQVAEPFCTRRWFEPTWNKERGFVEAVEEVSFRGLVISRGHRVDYARVNPEDCAQIFWREAVVMGEVARPFDFMKHNDRVVENLHALEARKRQFGLAPSEDALVDYYTRIAGNVNSIKTLKSYIYEHTDQFLKFDEKYWLDQLDGGTGGTSWTSDEKGVNRIVIPSPAKVKSKDAAPAPTLGGSIEHFRIGERVVTGEMVFDATRDCDGITLSLPYDLLTEISPAKFAMSIQQWREWMIESVIREMPKSVKKLLEAKRTAIDDEFFAALDNFPHKAPLLLLYEVLSNTKEIRSGANGASIDVPTVNPDKENHLRLHLVVSKPGFPEPYKLEISPEWGSYRMFLAVRPALVTFGIDFPLEGMRFGWRLGQSALMVSDESRFWQAFRKRVEGAHLESAAHPASQKTSLSEEKKQLIADRLNLLEMGGVFADNFETALKIWVAKSLAADSLDATRCVRFTGLEFSRGKKIRDFKSLAANTRSEDEEIRLSLVRATYESGLISADAFVKNWNLLKDFSVEMRSGNGKPTLKNKTIIAIHTAYQKELTLFERLRVLAELFNIELPFDASRESVSRENTELSANTLREYFRPYLKARYLKDHELKNARELLGKIDRTPTDDPEFAELYLQAKALLEDFEILKYKRKGNDAEDIVEEDALARLKGRFGRL
ncbi:ATP-dependent RNA helicase HrpA [Fibrobacter succinogenes]|uniref:RNA helicase HrpA n=1 Tax=Fibrobacter succinogenes TaxID=833 RepID=A0A380RTF2_FIBSU|nr:ATP-dependent RNA helicase HrpA [Fibrobacter succinogenes]PWJ36537.1 RNA helicase HrpA [Fibrobacter succinogenes subsp. elongatus]SUQ18786.1 RNA helicase HrpA [Fibrobacter succinogenes]